MARPVVSDLTELFNEEFGFHTEDDEATDWTLLRFLSGAVKPIEPVYELVRERDDGTPPWGILFDVDECPAGRLPYLAQYPGCILTPEMSEEQIRNEIREPTGWSRGRTPAIKIAGQRSLTGTKRVIVRPRTPEVGIHYIRTLASETPDEERTRAVLRAALPAWEVLDYTAISGLTLEDLEAAWPKSLAELEGHFTTLADIEDTLPTELPE